MYIGDKIPNFEYKMRDQEFDDVKQEKYFCVIISISNDLKMSDQCTATSKKVNMISLTSRNFDHKLPEVMKKLHTTFLRTHLECVIQFWSSNYRTLKNKTY